MNTLPQSSFIPKQSKNIHRVARQARKVSFPILSVLGYAFFIGSLLSAGTVFVYEKYTQKKLQQTVFGLESAIQSFNEDDMRSVVGFSQRVEAAQSILDNHISVTKILESLEEIMVGTVTITSLDFVRQNKDLVTVQLEVEAEEFDAVIFQRDVLTAQNSGLIESVQFLNVNYIAPQINQDGVSEAKTISFEMDLTLSTEQYLVRNNLEQTNVPVTQLKTVDSLETMEIAGSDPEIEEETF